MTPSHKALTISACLFLFPVVGHTAGTDTDEAPIPTETTTVCESGQIWDSETKTCVDAQDSHLNDDQRYDAAREFAYAQQYQNALFALKASSDQQSSRVLTYYGFIARKTGKTQAAMTYYKQALVVNPDNILTRSYMGMAFLQIGQRGKAKLQLTEIRSRGGVGTWPEQILASAIVGTETNDY
jgi:predicted Zn-dependent protease